jgi:hypothetical protein
MRKYSSTPERISASWEFIDHIDAAVVRPAEQLLLGAVLPLVGPG